MITRHNMENNVRVTLAASITAIDTSVTINKASGIYRDPPPLTAEAEGGRGVLTLTDSLTTPTKCEIVTYQSRVDNGDGTITLGALVRGTEGTEASAFSASAIAYQAITAGEVSPDLIQLDNQSGKVTIPGGGDPDYPSLWVGAGGVRVVYSGDYQNVIEVANNGDPESERRFGLGFLGGDAVVIFPPASALSEPVFPLRFTYELYPFEDSRHCAVLKDTVIERIEMLKAARLWPASIDSLVSNTTIDWNDHDIKRYTLSSNSAVTMVDTSDFILPDASCRRLTLLVQLANVTNPGYVVTWSSNVKWPGGAAPSFATGQNQIRAIDFLFDGTYFLAETMRTYQL